MPSGYSLDWSGQFEYLQRASERLRWIVLATIVITFGPICLVFRRVSEAAIIMLSLSLALVGGLWLIWILGHAVSVAKLIGFISLAGVAAEFGIIMHRWRSTVGKFPFTAASACRSRSSTPSFSAAPDSADRRAGLRTTARP